MDYKLIRSKRRTLALQINNNAELIVRAPFSMNFNKIDDFIAKKANWIDKTKQKINKQLTKDTCNEVYYLGIKYNLIIVKNLTEELIFDGKNFYLDEQQQIHKTYIFNTWYQEQFVKIAVPIIQNYAKKHKLIYNKLTIKNQKTIWGSCSAKNNINLNYMLLQAPINSINYVIIHELCHTIYKNHAQDFWHLVKSIMPDYKIHQKWLKNFSIRTRLN